MNIITVGLSTLWNIKKAPESSRWHNYCSFLRNDNTRLKSNSRHTYLSPVFACIPEYQIKLLWNGDLAGRPFHLCRHNRKNDSGTASSSTIRGIRPPIQRPGRQNRLSSGCVRTVFWIRTAWSAPPRSCFPCNRNRRLIGRCCHPLRWCDPCLTARKRLSHCCSLRTCGETIV